MELLHSLSWSQQKDFRLGGPGREVLASEASRAAHSCQGLMELPQPSTAKKMPPGASSLGTGHQSTPGSAALDRTKSSASFTASQSTSTQAGNPN